MRNFVLFTWSKSCQLKEVYIKCATNVMISYSMELIHSEISLIEALSVNGKSNRGTVGEW